MIASSDDCIYLNLSGNKKQEIDIDQEFMISDIKCVINDRGNFFLLANKTRGKLGLFLIRMDEKYPMIMDRSTGSQQLNGEFIIQEGNKLNIADANLFVLSNDRQGYRELILSYKTMYINTFNCNVIDLCDKTIIFRHESFQLWESKIKGFLTTATHDFVTLSKDGIAIIALGNESRKFKDKDQRDIKLHSLESTNYLKLEQNNHILFQDCNNQKLIMI